MQKKHVFFYFWRFTALEIISEMWHFDQFFYFSICSYIMPQLVCFENTERFHQSVDNLMHITATIVDVGCQNHLVMSVCNLFEPLLEAYYELALITD